MTGADHKRVDTWFVVGLAVTCGLFLSLQIAYVHTLPLVMDEYVSAHRSFELFRRTPYADFAPYKNVVGYAINGAWLHAGDHWTGLMVAKTFLVALNTAMLVVGALALRRHARARAVLLALVLFAVMSTFLERSAELRVDMESTWAGFASLLLLLRGKWIWAGALAAISFLISQKGVYFSVAAIAALLGHAGWLPRDRARLRPLIQFGGAALAVVLAYIALWSIVAGSPGDVFDAMFLSHRRALFDNPYGDMRQQYWMQSFWRNPLYYVVLLVALWRLDVARRARPDDDLLRLLVPYAGALVVLCLLHSKPWPYFIPMLLPTAFALHAIFFDRAAAETPRALTPAIAVAIAILGVVWPLRRVDDVLARDQTLQRQTVALAERLHEHGGSYLGGVPYLYRHDQAIPAFESLDNMRIGALHRAGGAALREHIDALARGQLAFVVTSYRIRALPQPFRDFFVAHFRPLWGPILGYAPQLRPGDASVELWLAGRYRLASDQPATIDGARVAPGDLIELGRGSHRVDASAPGQLVYFPAGIEPLLERRDEGRAPLFPRIYDY